MSNIAVCTNCNARYKTDKNKNFFTNCKSCEKVVQLKITSAHNDQSDNNNKEKLENKQISFVLNGTTHTIGNEHPLTMSLNQYIRDVLKLTGTKVTCKEGGCGACVINAEVYDFEEKGLKSISINSCLFPLYSCNNLNLTTVEGLGTKSKGFHEIQKRLVDKNGSQCGWCSSGMVMNMYSLLKKNSKPTKSEIESSYDGNICRCTGYRPILDAMKSFSIDDNPIDIEELNKLTCLNSPNACDPDHQKSCNNNQLIHIKNKIDNKEWFVPNSLDNLLSILKKNKSNKYRLVNGNTAIGVYKEEGPFDVYIDVKNVPELYNVNKTDIELTIGSGLSLNKLIETLKKHSTSNGFEYLSVLSSHLSKIANVAVRDAGSWSGNLVLRHQYDDFPSDVFIAFESADVTLTLIDTKDLNKKIGVDLLAFLKENLNGKLIYSVTFKPFDKSKTFIKTFKIMPRFRNAHAYVNAGFRFNLNNTNLTVESKPTIIFGGVSPKFVHATKTEAYLVGKSLKDETILKNTFNLLESELIPNYNPALAPEKYRKSLALSLFYKFILFVNERTISLRHKSAIESLMDQRPVSKSEQIFPVPNTDLLPVTKPMTKLNALQQTSGEAPYAFDLKPFPNQLYGAFILTKIANCRLDKIDTSQAIIMPGVVKILFAKDIPGQNSFVPPNMFNFQPEKLFIDDYVDYAGQPVGLVVAETHEQAVEAAKKVVITYSNIKKPILTIKDAIDANSFHNVAILKDMVVGDANNAIENSPHKVEGEISLQAQYHFYMEGQVSICAPNEDGYDVYSSTQYAQLVQHAVANVLGLKNCSFINVIVKQLGGGFGGKFTRPNIPATAAAVACKLLDRPVRVAVDLNTCLEMIGKRHPYYGNYKVGFDENGRILGINLKLISDGGHLPNDNFHYSAITYIDNAYDISNWYVNLNVAKTNTPVNTSTRAPDSFPAISIMENIIDHVAYKLGKDPYEVRMLNLYQKGGITPYGQPLPYFNVDELMKELKATSQYEKNQKEIREFNRNNRWLKKGASLVPLKWGVHGFFFPFYALVAVSSYDGSVAIEHPGIEMGQGIHVKLAQVCAYALKIPIESVSVKYINTTINPNGVASGASITSELVSQAVIDACKKINESLEPIRQQMPENYTWKELIGAAAMRGVDLVVRTKFVKIGTTKFVYDAYGAAYCESIIDVLTGEAQVLKTEILYDCGESMNSLIDIGQAEGAFMMGLGYWLFEKPKYDPTTGRCLSNGTWEYKPPLAQDIPIDFKIKLLDKNPNPLGILGSKAVGEPPLCLSVAVFLSIRKAIEEARREIADSNYFQFDSPASYDNIHLSCLVDHSQFKLN